MMMFVFIFYFNWGNKIFKFYKFKCQKGNRKIKYKGTSHQNSPKIESIKNFNLFFISNSCQYLLKALTKISIIKQTNPT